MKIYIWDKEFDLPDSYLDEEENIRKTVSVVKDLIDKESEKAKRDYDYSIKQIRSGKLEDLSEVKEEDKQMLKRFIKTLETEDPHEIWISVFDEQNEFLGCEKRISAYIDYFTDSKLTRCRSFETGQVSNIDEFLIEDEEVLIYAFCPELIEVTGLRTLRAIFSAMIVKYRPDICGGQFSKPMAELGRQETLIPFLKRLLRMIM